MRFGVRFLRIEKVCDLLARSILHVLWPRMQEVDSLFEKGPTFTEIGWRFRFQDELNLSRDIFNIGNL